MTDRKNPSRRASRVVPPVAPSVPADVAPVAPSAGPAFSAILGSLGAIVPVRTADAFGAPRNGSSAVLPVPKSRSAGVAESWRTVRADGSRVRTDRLTRDEVIVRVVAADGSESTTGRRFGSLRKAFAGLGLPDAKHIAFRTAAKIAFKANGTRSVFVAADGTRYAFEFVPVAA